MHNSAIDKQYKINHRHNSFAHGRGFPITTLWTGPLWSLKEPKINDIMRMLQKQSAGHKMIRFQYFLRNKCMMQIDTKTRDGYLTKTWWDGSEPEYKKLWPALREHKHTENWKSQSSTLTQIKDVCATAILWNKI